MKLSNLILLAGLASPKSKPFAMANKDEARQLICTVAYSSYYAGCIEQHYDKHRKEDAIQKVLKECRAKAEHFTVSLEVCKDAKFN